MQRFSPAENASGSDFLGFGFKVNLVGFEEIGKI
jgi:hypothetical protein